MAWRAEHPVRPSVQDIGRTKTLVSLGIRATRRWAFSVKAVKRGLPRFHEFVRNRFNFLTVFEPA